MNEPRKQDVSYLPKEAVVPLKPNLRFQVKILSIVKICQDLNSKHCLCILPPSKICFNLSLHKTKCTLFHQAAMTTSVVDRSYPVTLNLHLSFNISPPIHEVFSTSITFVSQPPNCPSLNMFEPSHWIFSAHSKSCPRSTPRTRSCPAGISRSSPPKGEKHLIMWGFSKKQHRYLGEI